MGYRGHPPLSKVLLRVTGGLPRLLVLVLVLVLPPLPLLLAPRVPPGLPAARLASSSACVAPYSRPSLVMITAPNCPWLLLLGSGSLTSWRTSLQVRGQGFRA